MLQKFEFRSTLIPGLIEIIPFKADDSRGAFIKDYSKEVFEKNGISHDLSEVFYTVSHRGVVRALHFQREYQQPKLVRCISGKIYDVVVDLRKNSPTFKQFVSFLLEGDGKREILVPAGCAHGYLVLEPSIVSYKCSEKFYGEFDDGIRWDDPDFAIPWPVELIGGKDQVILSEKDLNLQSYHEFVKTYGGF